MLNPESYPEYLQVEAERSPVTARRREAMWRGVIAFGLGLLVLGTIAGLAFYAASQASA